MMASAAAACDLRVIAYEFNRPRSVRTLHKTNTWIKKIAQWAPTGTAPITRCARCCIAYAIV
jgi:hypothetical protein